MEKEIIAKSNYRSLLIFAAVACLVSIPSSFTFLEDPDFRWLGIFFMSGMIFVIVWSLISMFIFPKSSIVKEGGNLIVYPGIFPSTLPIDSISSVRILPFWKGENVFKHGFIEIKAKAANGKEKTFSIDVKNRAEIVERLNVLINQSAS